jgi:2-succinyl-5-enolpyruvyl-6-hydroxy-3-cyclohexene-1-carboxylate synthase
MKNLLIRSTLTSLARLGVAEVCVAAGARNAPLITALIASDGIKLWSFFEERSAAFFALGRLMVDRMPIAVLTTSGTAAAELLPAVIEAHYQGLPLVVVTADRPRRFRGSGAPQAIEQKDLFGAYVSACIDVEEGASISWPARLADKPLHINVCLDEPLDAEQHGIDFLRHHLQKPLKAEKVREFLLTGEPTAVIACGLHPHEAREAAPVLEKLGLPIIAETTSNLWGRKQLDGLLLPSSEATFRALDIGQVIRLGGVPSARWWRDLESRPEVRVTNISRLPFPGLARKDYVQTLPWQALESLAARSKLTPAVFNHQKRAIQPLLDEHPLSEPAWMRELTGRMAAHDRVFIGNSLPIPRDEPVAGPSARRGGVLCEPRRQWHRWSRLDLAGRGERVTDEQVVVSRDAHDIAGVGVVHRLALAGEEALRVAEAHAVPGAHVEHVHVALELAGNDADEGHAVAVLRVHVRLDLEHERGNSSDAGSIVSPLVSFGSGGGESSRNRSNNNCTPKLFAALPKKTGVSSPASTFFTSKSAPAPSSSSSSSQTWR